MSKYAYYNEFNPEAAQWIRELIKLGAVAPGEVDERSIVDVKADDVRGFSQLHFFAGIGGWSRALRLAGWPDDRFVCSASCPCQPFSVAGAQKGIKDERHLWPVFFDLIKEIKPPVVFGEQVASSEIVGSELEASFVEAVQCGDFARANKLSKQIFSQSGFNEHPRWIDNLQSDLERENYAMRFTVLGAHSAGAPHIRQRIYFIAERRMENADQSVSEQFARSGSGAGEAPGSRAFNKSYGSSSAIRVGDTIIEGLEGHGRDGDGSHEPGRISQESSRSASETSGDGGLADSTRQRQRTDESGRDMRTGQQLEGAESRSNRGDDGENIGMGDSECSELQGSVQSSLGRKVDCETGATDESTGTSIVCDSGTPATNSPDGFWANSDWLFFRDGKWRPVESSIQRLSNGLPADLVHSCNISAACYPLAKDQEARPMRLKGYGNAIVAELAAKVVEAYMEKSKQ